MKRHSPILTNLLLSLPLAIGLLCAASSASAQTSESATIPFAFSVAEQKLPAGTYEVQPLSIFLLSLRNVETGKSQILKVNPEGGRVIETRSRLVFHRDGTEYSLTQVRPAGTSFYSALAAQPKPREAVAKNIPQTGSSIEVAMK